MDKVSIESLKCSQHSNKKLQFIQVNELLMNQNQQKPLFYCSSCFNHDLSFQAANYLMIDQILSEANNFIIPKWPPVNDYQIIQDLIDITQNQSQMIDYEQQISNFFDQLKKEFSDKIDIIQKKMINEAQQYPNESQKILQRYQEISKILDFKQLLTNQSNNLQDYSQACRQFIQQIESQKCQNTELLQNLLSQALHIKTNFNLEYPNMIKQNIFTFIDQISFFNQNININTHTQQNKLRKMNDSQNNESNRRLYKIIADLIMNLVTNENNFCADEFIKELDQNLKRVNPVFDLSKFNSILQENQKKSEFQKISQQIEEYVNHQILLKSDLKYENDAKNSLEFQQIQSIINSKMNFLNNQFTQQFERLLLEIKPFLKQINFTNIFTDQNKFDYLSRLSEEQVNRFTLITQKQLLYFDIKLTATKYRDGQQTLTIKQRENGEYEIEKLVNDNSLVNCISSVNLEKDVKYVFRFQTEKINEGDIFLIGLMRNANADLNAGYNDCLSCYFQNQNNCLVKYNNWGIQNQQKGKGQFQISREKLIELRVYLKEQILEIVEYPDYEYKLSLDDRSRQKIIQNNDLRLYIGLYNQGTKIILKDAELVKEFNN